MQQATTYPQLLGQVIRYRREKGGLVQSDIAHAAGLKSASGWSRVESGATTMTVVQLRRVARALGREPWELMKDVDDLARRIEEVAPEMRVLDEKPKGVAGLWWIIGGAALAGLVVGLMGNLGGAEEPG